MLVVEGRERRVVGARRKNGGIVGVF